MCDKCNGNCNSCNCTCQEPCLTPDCACKVFITTDCVTMTEDLPCANIPKGLTETEVLKALDAYICQRFTSVENFLQLVNIGTGSQIYRGITILGKRELRTLIGNETISIDQNADTISFNVNTEIIPLQRIDEGNGEGIIIRGRNPVFYGNVGLNALDLSTSTNNDNTNGATGESSFAANVDTIASEYASAAFNQGKASGYVSFAEGSGQARGQFSHAEGSNTIANNQASHAEGTTTEATGFSSHAQNMQTKAVGGFSDSSGYETVANGDVSIVGGEGNETNSYAETAIGSYGTIVAGNPSRIVWNTNERLFNIGNGFRNPITSAVTRKDAFTITKDGLATLPTVTNSLITAASGKAIITKEYLTTQLAVFDGSETKIQAGSNISITGSGTISNPYTINNSQIIDGSETKLQNGNNTTVTGSGTIASPYQVNVTGSETKIQNGVNTTVVGSGTTGSPYQINVASSGVQSQIMFLPTWTMDSQFAIAPPLAGKTVISAHAYLECTAPNNGFVAGDTVTTNVPEQGDSGGLGQQGIGLQWNNASPGVMYVNVADIVTIMGAYINTGHQADPVVPDPAEWRIKVAILYI